MILSLVFIFEFGRKTLSMHGGDKLFQAMEVCLVLLSLLENMASFIPAHYESS